MEIVGEIEVGGYVCEVVLVPGLATDTGNVGQFTKRNKKIEIDAQADGKQDIFCHELVHAIDYVYNNSGLTEGEVDSIGQGLYQVLNQWGVGFDWNILKD